MLDVEVELSKLQALALDHAVFTHGSVNEESASKIRAIVRQQAERIRELERLLPNWPGATEEGRREMLDGYLDRLAHLRVSAETGEMAEIKGRMAELVGHAVAMEIIRTVASGKFDKSAVRRALSTESLRISKSMDMLRAAYEAKERDTGK